MAYFGTPYLHREAVRMSKRSDETPLDSEALAQVTAMLGDEYHDIYDRNIQLVLGAARKVLATLNGVLDDVESADYLLNKGGDPITCHLILDRALKDTGRREKDET
jgi:hypothetical protein